MGQSIFLSYRRRDSRGHVIALREQLGRLLPKDDVFVDITSIPAGSDFEAEIKTSIANADVVLVLIGPKWLESSVDESGGNRENPGDRVDYVFIEIEAALRLEKKVIPVLLPGGQMPEPRQLPEPIREFARINAITIPDEYFGEAIRRLIAAVVDRRLYVNKLIPLLIAGAFAAGLLRSVVATLTRLVGSFPAELGLSELSLDIVMELGRAIQRGILWGGVVAGTLFGIRWLILVGPRRIARIGLTIGGVTIAASLIGSAVDEIFSAAYEGAQAPDWARWVFRSLSFALVPVLAVTIGLSIGLRVPRSSAPVYPLRLAPLIGVGALLAGIVAAAIGDGWRLLAGNSGSELLMHLQRPAELAVRWALVVGVALYILRTIANASASQIARVVAYVFVATFVAILCLDSIRLALGRRNTEFLQYGISTVIVYAPIIVAVALGLTHSGIIPEKYRPGATSASQTS